VKRDYFRNIEDAKYQVFWSDLEEPAGNRQPATIKEDRDAIGDRRSE
jgi:hypothetical protein